MYNYKKICRIFLCFFLFFVQLAGSNLKSFAKDVKFNESEYSHSLQDKKNENFTKKSENSVENDKNNIKFPIYDLLSSSGKSIFNLPDESKLESIKDQLQDEYKYLKNSNISSDKIANLADAIIMTIFLEEDMTEGENSALVRKKLSDTIYNLESNELSKYNLDVYQEISKKSEDFSTIGKKTASCLPENVVNLTNSSTLKNPAIRYDDEILVSISDFFDKSDRTIEYMDNNAAIIIKFGDNFLEIEAGNNIGYFNDKKILLTTPILNIEGIAYVPILVANSIGFKTISHDKTVIIY
ncbi:MAG: copper amine oxidase N-terminal domain-containing protein [Firmicutes bacterium]|nr:copper amine oxidase N-terminal domain-containing protein [Bacillota bacterium]